MKYDTFLKLFCIQQFHKRLKRWATKAMQNSFWILNAQTASNIDIHTLNLVSALNT